MENSSYLPRDPNPDPVPVADWRDVWLLRVKRTIVATVALALVVLFVMAMSGTADSLHHEPSPLDIAVRTGLCGGVPQRVYRLEGGPVHVDCFEAVQP